MKKPLLTTCWLLVILCLMACTSTKPAPTSSAAPLLPQKEQVWQLVSIRGKEVNRRSATVTLVVNPEASTLSGQAACNRYGADCRLTLAAQLPEGDRYSLSVNNLSSGTLQCPEAEMNAEARYLALLPKADALLVTAYTITLFSKDKEILHFELQ